MKILIAGANGQVGYCLTKRLANSLHNVVALTRNELNISDQDAVEKTIQLHSPQLVINAAAYTAVDKAETEIDLAYQINRDGPRYLAQAAAKSGASIFHISTDYVFAGNKSTPYLENDSTDPQGIYGLSKLAGENEVAQQNNQHIILRTAWVFGEHGHNFVKTMLRLGKTRDSLGVVADQEGGPTYAGDIANVLIHLANELDRKKEIPWGIYHYAGYPHVSWHSFASEIFSIAEKKNLLNKAAPLVNAITTQEYPTPAKRPVNSRLECQKIIQTFSVELSDWKLALQNLEAYSS